MANADQAMGSKHHLNLEHYSLITNGSIFMVGSVASDITIITKMHPLVAHVNCSQSGHNCSQIPKSQCKQSMVTKQDPDETRCPAVARMADHTTPVVKSRLMG